MKTKNTLRGLYKFPGFRARATLKPHPEDPESLQKTVLFRQCQNSIMDQEYFMLKVITSFINELKRPEFMHNKPRRPLLSTVFLK